MPRIVVVEDDESAASVVKSFLEQEGHLVKVFHNGADAQSFILSNEADLVILDWDLPGLSGIEILRDFRAFGGRCPILMLTGHQSVEDKELGFDEGADDYLTKPYNIKELGSRVKALLRRSQAAIGNVSTLGDIIIDFDTNKVMKSGRAVTLAPREFQLLSFLAKNRKDAVTMDSLMTRVWTSDSEITPEILRTVVRRLTKKLDPDGQLLRLDGILASDTGPTGRSTLGLGSGAGGGSTDEDFDVMLGRILDGKYELLKAIGGGASGKVYKARHKMMNVPVAVKILAPQLSTQPDLVRRFEREARASSLLRHPNIMLVHDMGMTEENQPYMVMELLDGFSLAELIEQNGKLTTADSLEIISQICRGIARAHEEQLIHRDLKPGNVMLVAENEQAFTVKIVDFGLAKSTRNEDGTPLTQTGALIGTPSYMSPEQCQAEGVDHRSDIYAIGCILYEMLTGSVPFPSPNILEVLMKHANDPPPPLVLPEQNPQLTRGFEYIIHTCLAKQPDLRYPTAKHILVDLESLKTSAL